MTNIYKESMSDHIIYIATVSSELLGALDSKGIEVVIDARPNGSPKIGPHYLRDLIR